MGNACGFCRDDEKEKAELKKLFKGSIATWLRTVVCKKSQKDGQVNLAELVYACGTALGMLRVDCKNFIDGIVQSTKDPKIIQLWMSFLPRSDQIHADVRKTALLRAWLSFDKDNSGDLSAKELELLVASLNFDVKLSQRLVEVTKEKARVNVGREPPGATMSPASAADQPMMGNQNIRFPEFEAAWNEISQFSELSYIWDELVDGSSQPDISETKLASFLSLWQKESSFQSEAKRIMLSLNGQITKEKFLGYLSSPSLNNALDTVRMSAIYHDMTQPLCNYFISSSHNTYLTGDQLTSNSSCDMYKITMLDGVRCVELDCWDGADPDHPVIYHGYTRTSKILFDDVIDTINKYAWVTSEYPVTLSLELHVSHESQAHMVKKMKSTFGSSLALPTWPGGTGDKNIKISPEGYKRKIILKAKRIKGSEGDSVGGDGGDVDAEEMQQQQDDLDESDLVKPDQIKDNMKGAKSHPLSKILSDCIIMESFHFKGYENPNVFHYQCNSIVETKSAGMSQSHALEYIGYNNRVISRIYPSGARIDSSNCHPQVHWNAGCQMIAMNWQDSMGYEMRLHKGRFMDNANSGYLLKPHCLLSGQGIGVCKAEWWTIEILSGFCIPKPMNGDSEIIDPYVWAFVEGPQMDTSKHVLKTEVINDNGFHPVWKGQTKSKHTFKVVSPELSTMVIQVWDKDAAQDDFLVEAFLPCHLIRPGVRCVSLRDIKSNQLRDTMLMVHFSMSHAPPEKTTSNTSRSTTPQPRKPTPESTPPPVQSLEAPGVTTTTNDNTTPAVGSMLDGDILAAPDEAPPIDSELL